MWSLPRRHVHSPNLKSCGVPHGSTSRHGVAWRRSNTGAFSNAEYNMARCVAAMLHSDVSDRSTRPLSWDTAAICSTMHLSTEAQEAAAALPSVHSSSTDDNIVTTHTQPITAGVLSTAWSVWNTAARAANWIMGRNVSTTANGNVSTTANGSGSGAVSKAANGI